MSKPRKCKHCGRMIRLVRLPSRKWIPIDAKKHPEGNVLHYPEQPYACIVAREKGLRSDLLNSLYRHPPCRESSREPRRRRGQPVVELPAIAAALVDGKGRASGDRQEEE